jgi:hypothetical protein
MSAVASTSSTSSISAAKNGQCASIRARRSRRRAHCSRGREAGARSEPARQQVPALAPREHPRHRAECTELRAALPHRGPRADLHALDHVDRRDAPEVLVERRVVVDERAIARAARRGERVAARPPASVRGAGPRRPPRRQRAERLLERAHRDGAQAVARVDASPCSVTRSVPCEDARAARCAAASRRARRRVDAAAARVEHQQAHAGGAHGPRAATARRCSAQRADERSRSPCCCRE